VKPRRRYWLRSDTLQDVLDREHLSHLRFADHIGLSRSYWSQLVNRKRPLSPDVRRDLLASRYLRGIPHEQLWDVTDGS
jgi:transcriptional regulator with XRE-family HTH domain